MCFAPQICFELQALDFSKTGQTSATNDTSLPGKPLYVFENGDFLSRFSKRSFINKP